MPRVKKIPVSKKKITGFVTEGYLVKLFRVTPLTVLNWRESYGLPYLEIPGDKRAAIRFILTDVLAWATKTHRKVYPISDLPNLSSIDLASDPLFG